MDAKSKGIYIECKAMAEQLSLIGDQLQGEAGTRVDVEWHADASYALRESIEYLETLTRNLKKNRTVINKVACLITGSTMRDKITTEHCTATDGSTQEYAFPMKRRYNPELFDSVMKELGVPNPELEMVRPHWPQLQAYCNALLAEGKNPPKGLDPNKIFIKYDLKIRRKKGVDE